MGVTYVSIFDFVTVGIIVDDISGLDTTVNADVDVDVDLDIDFAMSYLYIGFGSQPAKYNSFSICMT